MVSLVIKKRILGGFLVVFVSMKRVISSDGITSHEEELGEKKLHAIVGTFVEKGR